MTILGLFWIRPTPQFTTNVEYKFDHISKTKSQKIIKFSAKSVSEHCASFRTKERKKFTQKIQEKNFERP